ncbi:MAG: 4Fe-4S binding protein, partial [Rhodospirillales bacterium]
VMARTGRGLPANLLPFAVNEVTQVGLDFLAGVLAFGAEGIDCLIDPQKADETDGLKREAALAETVLDGLGYGAGRVHLLDNADPEALEGKLWQAAGAPRPMPAGDAFLPMGKKRGLLTLALQQLHRHAPNPVDVLALDAGAPFGAVNVDVAGCTLCLACVGSCPTGALKDNPDKPQLRFNESACVQCGLCKATCPEKVISLEPRLSFTDTARRHLTVKEEEPFECIRCGKPYGAKSSIEAMVSKLQNHPMFQGAGQLDRLKMCEDCRVIALSEDETHPFAGAPRPTTRTTDDYLREREELRAKAEADMKAKGLKT